MSGSFPLGLLALIVGHGSPRTLAGAFVSSRPWAFSERAIRARFAALGPALGRYSKATRLLYRGRWG
ncbi:MAG: hypothetical protein IPP10_02260 [Candidatus Competibacteraceae bacterium]|nr:hypothetical protein [Candidatus Competibacteraceae bacterium]MBK9950371.1 hypothetical protein [Candidatus Competibacteraceae bacterium]